MYNIQVFLVVGGLHGQNFIDNTELFSAGQSKWTTVGPLPQAIAGLAGATLANTVFMTGMIIEYGTWHI